MANARHGRQAVAETTTAMTEIEVVVRDAATKVHELGRLGERIGAVMRNANIKAQ